MQQILLRSCASQSKCTQPYWCSWHIIIILKSRVTQEEIYAFINSTECTFTYLFIVVILKRFFQIHRICLIFIFLSLNETATGVPLTPLSPVNSVRHYLKYVRLLRKVDNMFKNVLKAINHFNILLSNKIQQTVLKNIHYLGIWDEKLLLRC